MTAGAANLVLGLCVLGFVLVAIIGTRHPRGGRDDGSRRRILSELERKGRRNPR